MALNVTPEPLLEKVTAWAVMGLPWASSTVTCNVDVLAPSSGKEVGFAVSELVVLLGAPGTNVTAAVCVSPEKVAVTVTVCATVLARVTEHRPDALVLHVLPLRVYPVPLALKVTAWALTGLPVPSFTVICSVLFATPSAVNEVGVAVNVLVVLLGAPTAKVTDVVSVTLPMVAVMVSVWANVEARVVLHTPELLVEPLVAPQRLAEPLAPTDTA